MVSWKTASKIQGINLRFLGILHRFPYSAYRRILGAYVYQLPLLPPILRQQYMSAQKTAKPFPSIIRFSTQHTSPHSSHR